MIAEAEDPNLVRGESQVLIVGAGPAGCSAGIVLARAGVDVTVIDRARFPRDKTCGDAVSNLAMGLIDQLGAGEDVRQAPHALVERGVAAFPDGTRIERRYDRPGYIVPRLRSSSPPTDMARWGSRHSVVISCNIACWPCR